MFYTFSDLMTRERMTAVLDPLGRRLISAEPQPHGGELDHGKEVGCQLIAEGSHLAEVLQLGEEDVSRHAAGSRKLARVAFLDRPELQVLTVLFAVVWIAMTKCGYSGGS